MRPAHTRQRGEAQAEAQEEAQAENHPQLACFILSPQVPPQSRQEGHWDRPDPSRSACRQPVRCRVPRAPGGWVWGSDLRLLQQWGTPALHVSAAITSPRSGCHLQSHHLPPKMRVSGPQRPLEGKHGGFTPPPAHHSPPGTPSPSPPGCQEQGSPEQATCPSFSITPRDRAPSPHPAGKPEEASPPAGGKPPGESRPTAPLAGSGEAATEARAVTGCTKGDEITPSSSTKSLFGLCLSTAESRALLLQGTSHQWPFGVPSQHRQSTQLPEPGIARAFWGGSWGLGEAGSTPGTPSTHRLPQQPRLGWGVPGVVPITGVGAAAERCRQCPTGAPTLPQAPSMGAHSQLAAEKQRQCPPSPLQPPSRSAAPEHGAGSARQPLHPCLQAAGPPLAGLRAGGLHREGATKPGDWPRARTGSPGGAAVWAGGRGTPGTHPC